MLSAIVIARDGSKSPSTPPEGVARTLAGLVPALIAGLVRDLTLAGPASDTYLAALADEAGCALALADSAGGVLKSGLAKARGDIWLVIRAGFAPGAGFAEEAGDFLARGAGSAVIRAEAETFLTRLAPGFAPIHGVILRRARHNAAAADIKSLARGAGPVTTLRTRLRRVI